MKISKVNSMTRVLLLTLSLGLISAAKADVCDSNEIFKLMVETGHIDMKDESFCVELNEFPNVRVKMKEGKHDLGKPRELTERMAKQDADIKRLVDLLNSTSSEVEGQKFQVNARGFADGTFNEQKELDQKIFSAICVLNKNKTYDIDLKKVKNHIGSMDPSGAQAIVSELENINKSKKVALDQPVPWDSVKDDSRLKSMIRNSFLAKSRGDKLCSDIFGDSKFCQSSGEISPNLDTGEHCFAGCCDERRGNIIDIVAPQKDVMSTGGTGTYKPPFKSPSRSLQGKIQMAAAMNVFELNIEDDQALEKDILLNKKFDENLEKDRERFRKALAGTGCEKNDFAVDSARRVYWAVKGMKDFVKPELYDAVMKGDFASVYKFYESPVADPKYDLPNKNLLSVLFSGGNNTAAKLQHKGNCPKIRAEDSEWAFHKSYATCKLSSNSSPEVFDLLKKTDRKGRVSLNDNLFELSKMTQTKEDESQDFYVVQDTVTKNNYYLYDRKNNKSHYFTFDHTSDECSQLGPGYTYKPKANAKRIDAELSPACLQLITNSNVKIPASFTPQSPTVSGVVPSDPLNCLDASKGLEHEMRNLNPEGEATISMEAGNYQKPLCKLQSGGSLNITLDPKDLMVIGGQANGRQGFMCTGCSSGIAYDTKTKKFNYKARQESRPVGEEAGTQKEMARKTWSESSGSPLSMAGLKHLKTYVIPNCGPSCENACECLRDGDLAKKLKDPSVNALDFTDLSLGNSKAVVSLDPKSAKDVEPGKRQFSCVFTPPVPHTCSYNPLGDTPTEMKSDEHFGEVCPITEALKKLPKVNTEAVTEDKILQYKERCKKDSFPSTEAKCQAVRGGPMCAKKRTKNSCQEPVYKKIEGSGAKKVQSY
jgi:hypothetical protein